MVGCREIQTAGLLRSTVGAQQGFSLNIFFLLFVDSSIWCFTRALTIFPAHNTLACCSQIWLYNVCIRLRADSLHGSTPVSRNPPTSLGQLTLFVCSFFWRHHSISRPSLFFASFALRLLSVLRYCPLKTKGRKGVAMTEANTEAPAASAEATAASER